MASNVLTATIKVNTQGVKQSFQETGTAAKKAAVDIKGIGGFATGAIAETKQVIKSLTAELAGLDAKLLNSRGGQALASELSLAKNELKSLEKQANISGTATKNVFSQAFGQLRQLAFVLPGIGIAGIFNLAFEGISKLVSSIGSLSSANNTIRDFNEALASGSAKSIANLELLRAKIQDSNTTQAQRVELVKDYNKQADASNQLDLKQAGNLDLINAKIEQQITLLKQRAAVRAAEGVIAEKFEKLFSKQLEFQVSFPDLEKTQGDILSKATAFINKANDKLKLKPTFDTKELLALADQPKDVIDKLAASSEKFKVLTDKNVINTLQRFSAQLKSSTALTKNLGQAGIFEGLQSDISKAQQDIDDTLKLFGKILDFQGFSEKEKAEVVKAFEGIGAAFVEGSKDFVHLIELNPIKLSVPFQLALDEIKLTTQFSALNEELRGKLNQFALKQSVVPVNIKAQIQADTERAVPALVKELNDSFAKLKNAQFALPKIDLSAIFDNESFLTKWHDTFAKARTIAGDSIGKIELDFIKLTNRMRIALESTVAVLQPAFEALFNSFTSNARGLDAFLKALGQTVKQLVVKLLTAAAIAAVIKAILGSKGGSFSSIFTNLIGFKEKGGPVQGGKKYVVNEKGEEIFKSNSGKSFLIKGGPQFFIPPTSGKIITHNESNKILNSSREKVSNSIKNVYSKIVKNISGHRATGGNVTHGNNYVVNESGNEIFQTTAGKAILIQGGRQLFTAPSAGKIIPHLQTTKILNSLKNVKTSSSRVINNISSNIRNISGNRIGGGGVIGGNTYMTNEGGAEIFIPNTGQAIRVSPQSGTVKSGGMAISVDINGVLRGNDIVYAISNITRQQGRLK